MIAVLLLGAAAAVGLLAYFGLPEVLEAVAASGWGLVGMVAFHLVTLFLPAISWRVLAADDAAPLSRYAFARLLREAANNLLPFAQLSGELVAVRYLIIRGVRPVAAAAGIIADLTIETIAQLVFTGIALALVAVGGFQGEGFGWLVAGLALASLVIAVFFLLQRYGGLRLLDKLFERLTKEHGWSMLGELGGLHDAVTGIYRDLPRAFAGGAWHLAAWIVGAGELWIVFKLMGTPLTVAQVVAMEGLVHALRSLTFFVPLSLGVQEGGFVAAGALFGIGPEAALAAALIKRGRDIVIGVPVLLLWQAIEGRRWARERRKEVPDER
jgi:putative membrane protein